MPDAICLCMGQILSKPGRGKGKRCAGWWIAGLELLLTCA